jgi:hypothetical protein
LTRNTPATRALKCEAEKPAELARGGPGTTALAINLRYATIAVESKPILRCTDSTKKGPQSIYGR